METSHTFLDILRVPHADLWCIKNGESSCVERSCIEVLYSDTFKVFLLRIGHTKIVLGKSLPVVGTFAQAHKFYAYMFPTSTGFYMVKVMTYEGDSTIPITNFETILSSTCAFLIKNDMETKLMPYMDKMFEGMKEALHHAGESISQAFSMAHPLHPNQTMVRSFDALMGIESTGVSLIDIPSDELKILCDDLSDVCQHHLHDPCWKDLSEFTGTGETFIKEPGHTFLDILRVPHADFWCIKGDESTCKDRSSLEVLYSETLKVFMLRVGHSKIALDKSFEVLGTYSEMHKFHAYLFPTPTGFYMIKVSVYDDESTIPISNFETILAHTCTFMRKSGLEERIMPYIEKTFEGMKDSLHHAGESISRKLTMSHPLHPNQTLVRPFETLIGIEASGVSIVDIPSYEVKCLFDETKATCCMHLCDPHWRELVEFSGMSKGLEEPLLEGGMNIEPLGSMSHNEKKNKNYGGHDMIDKENAGEVL